MTSRETRYSIQVALIFGVFFFVLFNLVFRFMMDMRAETARQQAEKAEKEKERLKFTLRAEQHYQELLGYYQSGQYDQAIELLRLFNEHGKPDYKDLPEIKKEIRLFYLKNKLDFIPRIQLDDFLRLSREIDIGEDDTTEVFIRRPRYGQFFYVTDMPLQFEGTALSVQGDFSDSLVWTSSLDGRLGTGRMIEAHLSVGEHELLAEGTNGMTTGTMVTRIYIENAPESRLSPVRR